MVLLEEGKEKIGGFYFTLPLGKLKGGCLIEFRSNLENFINELN